jgi:hypothetical protein
VRERRIPGSAVGCLYLFAIALVTGVMLFINGSIVLVFVRALAQSGYAIAARQDIAQFLLLAVPTLMVVVQWKMIDYVWGRFKNVG